MLVDTTSDSNSFSVRYFYSSLIETLILVEVPLFVLEIGVNRSIKYRIDKVFKYISRFQYLFCCIIIYYDI